MTRHIPSKAMFVRVYRYEINKCDLQKWKKINDAARRIYKKYGGGNSKRLIRKDGDFIRVIEMDHYKSKEDFLKIVKQVDKDEKIDGIFKDFLTTVHQKRISEEECETV